MKNKAISILLALLVLGALGGCAKAPASSAPPAAVTSMAPEDGAGTQAQQTDTTDIAGNALGLTNVENARQVAGLTTSDGRTVSPRLLLRTGRLEDITDEEIDILVTEYGLTDVIDLRSASDAEKNPDRDIAGVANHLVPLYPDDFSIQLMERMVVPDEMMAEYALAMSGESDNPFHQDPDYVSFLLMGGSGEAYDENFSHALRIMASDEHSQKAFAEMFAILLDSEGSAIIHCTAGKDRTGAAVALILDLLGCDRDDIMAEYLLTNDYNAAMIEEKVQAAKAEGFPDVYLEAIPLIHGVTPYCLEAFFDELDTNYGSAQEYAVNQLGLTQEDIQALVDKYTHA